MEAYLFDTSALSIALDADHPLHRVKREAIEGLPAEATQFVSVIALAELGFGGALAAALGKGNVPTLTAILNRARTYNVVDVNHHTAAVYADVKSRIAQKYLAKALRRDRPKYIEDWIDQATGKILGIDENDVWMCAQAKERDLVLVTADKRMQRIPAADPAVRLLLI
jgi:predicted nucleic acid-binding protein